MYRKVPSHCCPPHSPTPDETRKVLDEYKRAILFHKVAPKTLDRTKQCLEFFEMLVQLEGTLFKDGYYKAFAYTAGPCMRCKEYAAARGTMCINRGETRPAMESCGIDVFQTAWNNGLPIQTLREKTETQNIYCLLLVD